MVSLPLPQVTLSGDKKIFRYMCYKEHHSKADGQVFVVAEESQVLKLQKLLQIVPGEIAVLSKFGEVGRVK